MAKIVNEMWSKKQLTAGLLLTDWTATRVFSVIGTTSQMDAIAACASPLAGGVAGAGIGYSHPANSQLICKTISSDDGVNVRTVTAQYTIPDLAAFDPDPLKWQTRWRWKPGNDCKPRDTDFYGNPKINSAGSPFRFNSTRFKTLHVQAIRNEPFYDIQLATAIQNTTSSQPWTIPLAGATAPGQVSCETMECTTDIYEDVPYVTIVYSFEVRKGQLIDGTQEYDGFFDPYLDVGSQGWRVVGADDQNVNAVAGRFATDKGDDADEILLDGTGAPVDSNYKILVDPKTLETATAVANPTVVPKNVVIRNLPNGGARLLFRDYDVYDYTKLKL